MLSDRAARIAVEHVLPGNELDYGAFGARKILGKIHGALHKLREIEFGLGDECLNLENTVQQEFEVAGASRGAGRTKLLVVEFHLPCSGYRGRAAPSE